MIWLSYDIRNDNYIPYKTVEEEFQTYAEVAKFIALAGVDYREQLPFVYNTVTKKGEYINNEWFEKNYEGGIILQKAIDNKSL